MNKDFKIDFRKIKENNSYTYLICLNYIGYDPDIIETIEDVKRDSFFYEDMGSNPAYNADDYCLFMLILTIGKDDVIEGQLEVNEDDTISYSMKSNAHLGSLYNNTLSNELKNFREIKNLKGFAEIMLCVVLNNIISNNILNEDSIITLEASGRVEGKGMEGLVKYYEKLGFKQAYPALLDLGIKNSIVPMKATIGDIIQRCRVSDKSNQIEKILQDLLVREF